MLLRARYEKEQNSSMFLIDADSLQNQANRGPCGNVQDQGNPVYANRANARPIVTAIGRATNDRTERQAGDRAPKRDRCRSAKGASGSLAVGVGAGPLTQGRGRPRLGGSNAELMPKIDSCANFR
jgi:hypothetical protein